MVVKVETEFPLQDYWENTYDRIFIGQSQSKRSDIHRRLIDIDILLYEDLIVEEKV
jgi:7,8-dihydro-6-hydroxymethylpterin-pyrophosphokinase